MRVVLDTNVLVSAFRFNQELLTLVESCLQQNDIVVISSLACYSELVEILVKKFHQNTEEMNSVERACKRMKIVNPRLTLRVVRDPRDNKFIEAAVEGKADYLVSGDKDLLELKNYGTLKIVPPNEFLKVLTI